MQTTGLWTVKLGEQHYGDKSIDYFPNGGRGGYNANKHFFRFGCHYGFITLLPRQATCIDKLSGTCGGCTWLRRKSPPGAEQHFTPQYQTGRELLSK